MTDETIDAEFGEAPRELRILACADLHVSATQNLAGLQPVDRITRRPLVLSQARQTLAWIGQTARAEDCDLVLVAGDTYPDPRPLPAAEAVVQEAFAAWADQGALVLVLLGNHDRPNGQGTHALEPLRHLRPGKIEVVDAFRPLAIVRNRYTDALFVYPFDDPAHVATYGNNVVAWVFPVPYPARAAAAEVSGSAAATSAVLAGGFNAVLAAHAQLVPLCREHTPGAPCILFGHGTLASAAYNDYQTVPLADSPISTDTFPVFDLAVWGHLHKRQAVASPTVEDAPTGTAEDGRGMLFTHGYIGSPDRMDFGEEDQPKGVSTFTRELAVADGGGPVSERWACRFHRNPGIRRFVTLHPDEVRDHLAELKAEAERGEQAWVYRVVSPDRDGISEADNDAVAEQVRELKACGVTITNGCKVARADRARVEDVQTELGYEGVLSAVFTARPDLAPDEDAIRNNIRAWAAEQGSAGKVGAA